MSQKEDQKEAYYEEYERDFKDSRHSDDQRL